MLYLAFIFHMHQPYYKDLLTQETGLPWVRLHGVKDYLDMIKILEKYPAIHQTFNLVPSLIEQIEDYVNYNIKDKFLELSYKDSSQLNAAEKKFILENFFSINKERVIAMHPRYYQLYLKKEAAGEFELQDYLDLQVWFNLAWIDPYFIDSSLELKQVIAKGRFFSEEDKRLVLNKQLAILEDIIPSYKASMESGQIEVTISPQYHPILPLLVSTNLAKEANPKTILPKKTFAYPEDAQAQVDSAVKMYLERFSMAPSGMWPSEESVCESILPFLIQSRINWIVTDEAILFKSLKKKKRDSALLYQPHLLKRESGSLNIIFRDRNLSDLLGFVYHKQSASDAVLDFMKHLENINLAFKGKDILVTVAMDGENAWEYYARDGHDFLNLLYQRLSESKFIKTTTVNEYLKTHSSVKEIKRLAAGSWIYGNFGKWMDNPYKALAWEYLSLAREELEKIEEGELADPGLARKQMYILEGSDWFWWYGEDPTGAFDALFRMHLSNFYKLINREIPRYLQSPLTP
jgi:alpha-amylase/alpha-mannosidase (GH57 family)